MQSNWAFPGVVAAICGFSGIGLPGDAGAAAPAAAWPHALTAEGVGVVVYQPQAIDWSDHEKLTTREAIAITPAGDKTAMLGTIVTSFSTRTDAATGDVILSNPALVSSHFPALDTAQAARIDGQIAQALPKIEPKPVPLPSVLLSLQQLAEPNDAALDNDPPLIFYSAKAASLVVFDGEPVLAPVGKTGLSFAVNTNWDVFTDGQDWFLLNNGSWMAAPAYAGPYNRVAKLPKAFSAIPADQSFAAARKAIPPAAGGSAAAPARATMSW
jgi:hypothetical protein